MVDKGRKVIITYETFDMFHIGYLNPLKRAKEFGDYSLVGTISENYDRSRDKLNGKRSLIEHIENVSKTNYS